MGYTVKVCDMKEKTVAEWCIGRSDRLTLLVLVGGRQKVDRKERPGKEEKRALVECVLRYSRIGQARSKKMMRAGEGCEDCAGEGG